ncbi:D-alanyl-D-alanine carboxypeptidase/D-alanyl-D-alanine-endopeptidase [Rothia sp. P5766]|uniref:D-alanyl-D-alanine carboxypeptidase/D-alanyl-D-alanine endopeptidase n=1 Tax=unclassified Rothia (in: high G+C Gram-positive bacteria) TaxID=2689056 RepID=UPI003AE88EE2
MTASRQRPLLAWALTGMLIAGCSAAGMWALPRWQEADRLQQQALAPTLESTQPALEAVSAGTPVDTATLKADIDQVLGSLGQGTVSAQVVDAESGQVLYSRDAHASRIPASNMKLLVDYAVLATAPQARLKTSVELNDPATLTLVSGGDSLLVPGESTPTAVVGHAGIETLAQRTIDALKAQGTTKQSLAVNLDIGVFAGDSFNSEWAQEDIESGFISAVTPLAFYSHYSPTADGSAASTNRPKNAPAEVHQSFIAALNRLGQAEGLSFTAGFTTEEHLQGTELAAVESATLAEQSAHMMLESDNSLAENLGRNLSVVTGGDGSTRGAIDAVRTILAEAGLPTSYTQKDISGLSMNNRVSSDLLTQLALRAVIGSASERLALEGLPVAGYSGTLGLATRFNDADEVAGRGLVRAKTGTLNSVLSLTGYTVTGSGRVLVFSVIMNDLDDTRAAKSTIDRFAATLTDR